MTPATSESRPTRYLLTALTVVLLLLFLLLPLAVVFTEALSRGLPPIIEALTEPDTVAAIQLTLLVAAISVPLNTVCGLAGAWCIGRFQFRGHTLRYGARLDPIFQTGIFDLAVPEGLEPPTLALGKPCSIRLSYRAARAGGW